MLMVAKRQRFLDTVVARLPRFSQAALASRSVHPCRQAVALLHLALPRREFRWQAS
jgi:hypothetical protein